MWEFKIWLQKYYYSPPPAQPAPPSSSVSLWWCGQIWRYPTWYDKLFDLGGPSYLCRLSDWADLYLKLKPPRLIFSYFISDLMKIYDKLYRGCWKSWQIIQIHNDIICWDWLHCLHSQMCGNIYDKYLLFTIYYLAFHHKLLSLWLTHDRRFIISYLIFFTCTT